MVRNRHGYFERYWNQSLFWENKVLCVNFYKRGSTGVLEKGSTALPRLQICYTLKIGPFATEDTAHERLFSSECYEIEN